MDSSNLGSFLKRSKNSLQVSEYKEIHAVLGNEACDLDSAVCAIVYAYYIYMHNLKDDVNNHCPIIPVLNIPREDYRLRTEITYMMERLGIDAEDFTFINEIDLKTLKDDGKLKVTLVDHNIIPVQQNFLKNVLVEIIDHHKDEVDRQSFTGECITIEPVGSCSTLVAEKILEKAPSILDEQVTSLILAAILLDTVNLDPRAGRKTEKDVVIVEQLKASLKSGFSCDEVYTSVSKAKFDTSTLTCMEILRKDFKAVPKNPSNDLSIGISSIGLSLQSFSKKENVTNHLGEFSKLKALDVLVVMSMYFQSMDGPPCRQIAVCGQDKGGVEKLSKYLNDVKELELKAMDDLLGCSFCFDQMNVKASRKLVFPLVMKFLNSY